MHSAFGYIAVMAVVTYLIRMIPLVLLKKEITNKKPDSGGGGSLRGCICAGAVSCKVTAPAEDIPAEKARTKK